MEGEPYPPSEQPIPTEDIQAPDLVEEGYAQILPGVFIRDSDDSIIMKGYTIEPATALIAVPEGEALIEVPRSTLGAIAKAIEEHRGTQGN